MEPNHSFVSQLDALPSFLDVPFDSQLYSFLLDQKEVLQTSEESTLQNWLNILEKKVVQDVLYNRELIEK